MNKMIYMFKRKKKSTGASFKKCNIVEKLTFSII